jgi:acyl-[acyl-carrier-protein]-phospholipid O-acyltransferase/long-chain-fatty-acid--[acyl-carrier-protein] ligase
MSEEKSQRPLASKGFVSLVVTQFFGVINDNLLKQVLSFGLAAAGIWSGILGEGGQSWVAMALVLPFLLFGAIAGQLADCYSKQLVTVRVKQAEFLIVLVAFAGFYFNSVWLSLFAMFLLGTQSAFFGPAKYGVIPELVDDTKISMANAAIIMLTNVAAILAVVVGGALYEAYRGTAAEGVPDGLLWLPGLALLVFAILGLIAAKQMPPLEASAPEMKVKWEFFAPYLRTIKKMLSGETPIFVVCMLKAAFYFLAYSVLLILADYTIVLGLPEKKVSVYLFGTIGVSIAVGSVLAGFLSRGGIQARLILVGGIGFGVAGLLLAWAPSSYVVIHQAEAQKAAQGLAAIPEGAKVSYFLDRSKKRLNELRSDFEYHKEQLSLSKRLEQIKQGQYDAMVISTAYLGSYKNRKVTPDKDSNGTEYYALSQVDEGGDEVKDAKGKVVDSGLVATPIEVRTKDFWRVVICLFIVGASAGMYVTPLQALLQKLSPVDARGQYIAASNAIDTVWEGTAIGLFYLLRNVGVGSQEIFFLVVGVAGLTVTLFVLKIQPHIHKPEWN